jgi:hypothetical protein
MPTQSPERLSCKLASRNGAMHWQNQLALDRPLRGQFSAVGDDDDDGRLKVEGVPALAVHVDARLHSVDIENVENLKISI